MLDWLFNFFAHMLIWVGGIACIIILAALLIMLAVEIHDVFKETGEDPDYDDEEYL